MEKGPHSWVWVSQLADHFKSNKLSILQRVLYITIVGSTLLAHLVSTKWHGETRIVHADIQTLIKWLMIVE